MPSSTVNVAAIGEVQSGAVTLPANGQGFVRIKNITQDVILRVEVSLNGFVTYVPIYDPQKGVKNINGAQFTATPGASCRLIAEGRNENTAAEAIIEVV